MTKEKPVEGDIKGLKVFYKGEWTEFTMKGKIIIMKLLLKVYLVMLKE